MVKNKIDAYISKLIFNNGKSIKVKQDDIVVFVGANNAGKSQSLKDIYTLSSNKSPTIVVFDIEITKSCESLQPFLQSISNGDDQGKYMTYSVLGKTIAYTKDCSDIKFSRDLYYGDFRDFFVVNLDTVARLGICNPPQNISRNATKQHPIHYAAFDGKFRRWLSDNFKKAFGIEVTPNTQYGATVPLCIGDSVKLIDQYEDEQQRLEAYAEILYTYKQVQNQGDGIKSFTGILLYLMLDYYRTYLIDEPESFLHAPQARIMGRIIGETLTSNQQAFICTHSEEIIKGLLEVCPERIKLVRITRKDDTNDLSILSNNEITNVWNDPLLKYSNILSSLFHNVVVLCESDSDCKMYSIVDNFIKQAEGKYSETLFIHCGGKHRMARISSSLRALDIDIRLIADIDILNDETIFKNIVEAYDINWSDLQRDYNILASNLHSSKEKINRNEAKTIINNILDSSYKSELTSIEIRKVCSAVKVTSKWEALKDCGISAIPSGDATNSYINLTQSLQKRGIYIVIQP